MAEAWLLSMFAVAVVASFGLTGLAAQFGHRLGLLDYPRRGELQASVVPRTGGYGICAAFVLAALVSCIAPSDELVRSAEDAHRLLGVLLGLLLLLPLAYADDRARLGPLPQLAGQFAIAAVPVSFGLWIDNIALPFVQIVP